MLPKLQDLLAEKEEGLIQVEARADYPNDARVRCGLHRNSISRLVAIGNCHKVTHALIENKCAEKVEAYIRGFQEFQHLKRGQEARWGDERLRKEAVHDAVCQKDCEGIVAKHRLAPYVGKPQTWLKVLNPDYSQMRGRKEMFEKFHEKTGAAPVSV
jgi:hypothetical protein